MNAALITQQVLEFLGVAVSAVGEVGFTDTAFACHAASPCSNDMPLGSLFTTPLNLSEAQEEFAGSRLASRIQRGIDFFVCDETVD